MMRFRTLFTNEHVEDNEFPGFDYIILPDELESQVEVRRVYRRLFYHPQYGFELTYYFPTGTPPIQINPFISNMVSTFRGLFDVDTFSKMESDLDPLGYEFIYQPKPSGGSTDESGLTDELNWKLDRGDDE